MARRKKQNPVIFGNTGWRLVALAAFAIAMGHLEATVVVYIRALLDVIPTPEQFDPATLRMVPAWVVVSEQAREASTLVMLVSLAWLAGRNIWERIGVFVFAFGIWDIFYYVALKAMIDWPGSLGTTDCLFLIPQPWFGPVWLPLSISLVLVITGAWLVSWQGKLLAAKPRRAPRTTAPDAEETTEIGKV